MSETAKKELQEIVLLGEEDFETVRGELMDRIGVKQDTAYQYIMEYCWVKGRADEKRVVGMKEPVDDDQNQAIADSAVQQTQVPLYQEAKVVELPNINQQAAQPTEKKFRNMTILEESDHPLVPETTQYFERRIGEATDVDKATWAMNNPDYGTLLIGETSVGKGQLIKYICSETNRPLARLNFGVRITKEKLIGHYAPDGQGDFEWKDGILTKAVRNGWVFLADEINAAPPEALVALNGLLEDRRNRTLEIEDLGEIITPHSEFRVVGTMNPDYVGTSPLNPAFKNRFIPIRIPYLSQNAEVKLIESRTCLDDNDQIESLVKMANDLREQYPQKISTPVGTRDLLKIADMTEIVSFEDAVNTVMEGLMGEEDRQAAMKVLKLHTKNGKN